MPKKKLSSAAIEAAHEPGAVAVLERPAPAAQPAPEWGMLSLDAIDPSPTNPRQVFDAVKMEELASSIVRFGVQQPLTVRRVGDRYELIAGERRFRAARLAELAEVPAIVRQYSDADVLELQLIENRQREDVHPIEEARHFKRILDAETYGKGIPAIEAIAAKVGLSTSFVYQRLKLLDLCPEVQDAFLHGYLTAAHAVMIARLQPADQSQALSYCCYTTNYEGKRLGEIQSTVRTVKALAQWIASQVHMDLSNAPWKMKDAELVVQAGSCSDCAKRTGANANLFGESSSASDCCLDRACYAGKQRAFVKRKVDLALQANPGAIRLSLEWNNGKDGSLGTERWSRAKEGDPDAQIGVITTAPNYEAAAIGNTAFFKPVKRSGDKAAKATKITPEAQAAAAERQAEEERKKKSDRRELIRSQRVENLMRRRVYDACVEAIENYSDSGELIGGPVARALIAKCLLSNHDGTVGDSKQRPPSRDDSLARAKLKGEDDYGRPKVDLASLAKMPEPGTKDLSLLALDAVVFDEICFHDYHRPSGFGLFTFAECLSIDVELIRKEADWELLSKKAQKERLDAEKVDVQAKAPADPLAYIKPMLGLVIDAEPDEYTEFPWPESRLSARYFSVPTAGAIEAIGRYCSPRSWKPTRGKKNALIFGTAPLIKLWREEYVCVGQGFGSGGTAGKVLEAFLQKAVPLAEYLNSGRKLVEDDMALDEDAGQLFYVRRGEGEKVEAFVLTSERVHLFHGSAPMAYAMTRPVQSSAEAEPDAGRTVIHRDETHEDELPAETFAEQEPDPEGGEE